jgi:predicted dehydrogenase
MNQVSRYSRRRFLKQASKLGAGVLGLPMIIEASALGRDGHVAPSERIVMGAVGVGAKGLGDMMNAMKPGVQMVAVCDVDSRHLRRAKEQVDNGYGNKDCRGYRCFHELLSRADIQAITQSCPDHWHAYINIAAAKAGKDVFGQKPLAHSIAEGRAIVDTIHRYDCVFQTGSQQRSMRIFRHACELVRNGYLGQVKRAVVGLPYGGYGMPDGRPIPVPDWLDWNLWQGPALKRPYCHGIVHGNWRSWPQYGGGQLADWIGHHGDIAQWGLEVDNTGPVEVEAEGKLSESGLPYQYRATCRYANGVEIVICDESQEGIERGVTFEGTEGSIHAQRSSGLGRNYRNVDILYSHPASLAKIELRPNDDCLHRSDDHAQNFVDCIRTRKTPIASVDVAHQAITMGYLVIIAIQRGKTIHYDPVRERITNDEDANRLIDPPSRSPWIT